MTVHITIPLIMMNTREVISTHMEPVSSQSGDVRYSEDVKELLLLAKKVAKKAKSPLVEDTHCLQALLMSNRAFTRVDALLKDLNAPPRTLDQKLRQVLKSAQPVAPHPLHTDHSTPPVLETAKRSLKPGNGKKPTLEVEDLLKAMTRSEDPRVAGLFQEEGITEARIDSSLERISASNGIRNILFLARETIEVVLAVLFFLIIIKEGLGELRLIPSESMVPLLQVEDRVVIEKLTHWSRPYQRGDVLVFYPPMTQLKQDPWSIFLRLTGFSGLIYHKEDNIDVAYIKRLIGLPGDSIEVKPGQGVFINGKLLNEPYVREVAYSCTAVQPQEICGPITVPPNAYFFMGDNRNQSADSRFWGFEPQERVIGRAVFRIWPLNRLGPLPAPPYAQKASSS